MIRPIIEVSKEEASGRGIELTITSRWAHFGFWLKGRGVDIYTGKLASDIRRDNAERVDTVHGLVRRHQHG